MESAALAAYAQAVGVELGRAQSVLKVVGAPREALVDTFFELMPDASPSEFQRIVDLKVCLEGGVCIGGWEGGGGVTGT